MHVHVWELIGIVAATLLLMFANYRLVKNATAQNIIYVLLVLLAGFLILASLGILPDMGVSVSG